MGRSGCERQTSIKYLAEQLKDAGFAERFEKAGEAWDIALQIAALREQAGFSQRDLARKLRTQFLVAAEVTRL